MAICSRQKSDRKWRQEGERFCRKVLQQRIRITFDTPKGDFSFLCIFPSRNIPKPLFLHIAFRPTYLTDTTH